ncbi:hypothetical protein ACUY2E_05270 [Corynebacterium confusum]
MDLSLIQTHIDNFVDTWEGWGKVFNAIPNIVNNLFNGVFFLSSNPEAGDFFPNTAANVDASEAAAEAAEK